ncbi:hypothetical protein ABT143_24305, partial [Streptomyces sp. NPDC002033]|uniref:hypothetical protein n=1 Tax=Streptomyces sp. NPDC002033 TaxID=3154533 RepID=UPI00332BA58A
AGWEPYPLKEVGILILKQASRLDAFSGYPSSPAAYGSLASASADLLDRHARDLENCALHSGWSSDGAGEQFRTVLLGHAERCAQAASDVRRAARRLSD